MRGKPMFLVWLLILGAVLAAFFMMDPARTQTQEVSISEFINRVETGEVTSVTISGDHVRGTTPSHGTVTTYVTDRTELNRAMREHHVSYREEPPSQTGNMLMLLLKLGLPILLLVFLFRAVKNAGGGGGTLKQVMSSKATLHTEGKVTFNDVAGVDEAKEECKDLVQYLKDPAKFMKLGGRPPKGVLMLGETGCGKTLLARAIAGEAGVPFFSADASSFVEMFVGVGAARVRDLFENASKRKPCIIFIDEIDAVGKSRGGITVGGGHDEREQTLNQLLICMDGFQGNEGVIVIGATNRPEVLDKALLRPGRFNRHVVVPKPDINGRLAILKVHARGKPLGPDADLSIVARGTPGMSGADLENLLNEAALQASKLNKTQIEMADIEYARYKVLMGPERKGVVMSEEEKNIVAHHEAGHTVIGWYTPECDPVNHVTIVARGQALGLTWTLPVQDRKLARRSQLLAEIKMLYGGRVAEEMLLGNDFTTGAGNDLMRLTAIAKHMVTDYGMADELGQRTFGDKQQGWFEQSQNDYSDETAAAIDREIKKLTSTCYDDVKRMLTEKKELLLALAAALREKESLGAAEIEAILGPRPVTA
ncbi:MAG TPA: ATP-dependent zinc metalloprotease FtsH [Candidatus Binatia bacterium]|nr:ATP-dependent zinc metalloprotease FtsH [Candidatus Binatia bacterium]